MPAKYAEMSVVRFRVVNFMKMVSMFMVLASLIYFYAYVDNRLGFMTNSHAWYFDVSKSVIFYSGLAVFALFNLVMGIGINLYKNARGYDEKSLLFKSEMQKEAIHFWLITLITSINFLIACSILYLAMIRINGITSNTDYIFLPAVGLVALIVAIIGLLVAFTKK